VPQIVFLFCNVPQDHKGWEPSLYSAISVGDADQDGDVDMQMWFNY